MHTTVPRNQVAVDATSELRESAPSSATAFGAIRLWESPAGVTLPNAFTCDVEDYFHVGAFENVVSRASWRELECRLPRNIDRILQLMSDAGAYGTFFTLGWVAKNFPEVVRRIAEAGHELACHSMEHVRAWKLRPEEFRQDIVTAKKLLEDAGGAAVRGYRAPSWSLDARTPWAHQLLAEAGYQYSSSVYPIAHDHYGVPNAPPAPFYVSPSGLLEIPATTLRFAGRNWPAAGGGYFRLLPFGVSLRLLRRARSTRGVPAMFYFHPWELDPGQPRIRGASLKSKFRHYINLDKTESRLRALLAEMPWGRMDKIFCQPSPT